MDIKQLNINKTLVLLYCCFLSLSGYTQHEFFIVEEYPYHYLKSNPNGEVVDTIVVLDIMKDYSYVLISNQYFYSWHNYDLNTRSVFYDLGFCSINEKLNENWNITISVNNYPHISDMHLEFNNDGLLLSSNHSNIFISYLVEYDVLSPKGIGEHLKIFNKMCRDVNKRIK